LDKRNQANFHSFFYPSLRVATAYSCIIATISIMSDEEAAAAGQPEGPPVAAAADAGGAGERRASRNDDLPRHLRDLAQRPSSRDCLHELAELELAATTASLDAETAQAYLQAAAQHLMVVVPGQQQQRQGGSNRQGSSNLQQVLAEVLQVRCFFVFVLSLVSVPGCAVRECNRGSKSGTREPAKYGMCLDIHPLSQTRISC